MPSHAFRPLLLASLALLSLSGCSGNAPEINFIELYPVRILHPVTDAYQWELTVLGQVFDEDGFSDLEELYIADSEDYRYWTVSRDDWELLEMNEENWIAVRRLLVQDSESLPGDYRAILVDASGTQSEREFYIPQQPDEEEQLQPELRYDADEAAIEVLSLHDEHRITAYTPGGRRLGSVDISESSVKLSRITNQSRDIELFVNTLVPYRGYLYRTGPVQIP